ncbi:MAG TPA: hypothetical protein PKX91_05825 [Clostridia bacterium]|jgi:hypothetical protein|nr:hypothetical protein [Clostridia bacterium]
MSDMDSELKPKEKSNLKVCPHCGHPLPIEPENNEANDITKPIDPSWTSTWEKKPLKVKIIMAIISVLAIILVVLLVKYWDSEYITSSVILSIPITFTLPIFILSLFLVKVKKRVIDGYTILVYAGLFKHILVVEDVVQESGLNRNLNGVLPNGKEIYAKITMWDASIEIGVL